MTDVLIDFAGKSNAVTLQNTTLSNWNFATSTDSTNHVSITGTYTGPTGCFITTATAEQFGWVDDIETYYRIAPQIVEATRHDQKLYRELWSRSLRKAVAAVVAGEYQRAYDIYRKMVDDLAVKY